VGGPLNEVYEHSSHPYTHALLEAVPVPDPAIAALTYADRRIPNAINPPPGCHFSPALPLGEGTVFAGEPAFAGNPSWSSGCLPLARKTFEVIKSDIYGRGRWF